MKLLVDAGKACMKFHNEKVRDVNVDRLQCDEIWSFVYSKDKNTPEEKKGNAGDVWTWTAIDADTKLIISWFVGNRDWEAAHHFMRDVSSRIKGRMQITTDGFRSYPDAINEAFDQQIDFAQLVKHYSNGKTVSTEPSKGYSKYVGAEKVIMFGNPNLKFISTSYVERQNLNIRMGNRRFTRKTNAFSKKVENHCYSLALWFVYYNFVRIHKTLSITPAMQAGLTKRFMTFEDMVKLMDNKTVKRGSYKKKNQISN
jgi:IS1 family transposase